MRRLAVLAFLLPLSAHAEPEHELRVSDVAAHPGERASASLTVAPLAGRTIHAGAPLRIVLSVEPETGLTLARKRLRRRDAADPRADAPRFDLSFTADKAGSYKLTADVRFWLCGKRTCWPVRDKAVVNVTVTDATAPPPPASGSSATGGATP